MWLLVNDCDDGRGCCARDCWVLGTVNGGAMIDDPTTATADAVAVDLLDDEFPQAEAVEVLIRTKCVDSKWLIQVGTRRWHR